MNRLCTTFQLLAQKVWQDRDDGVRCGLDPSEETITETLLLELARHHPSDVVVQKFTKAQEGKQFGADWEWWFVGGGRAWGARVQAKKLDGRLLNYRGIDYPHGRKPRQITRFLSASARDRLYPLYCFYNLPDLRLDVAKARCPLIGHDLSLLGCAIASGFSISRQRKKGEWEVAQIAPLLAPWHCLVCCPFTVATSATGAVVPDGIENWVSEHLASGRGSKDNAIPPTRPLSDAPQYVRRAYELGTQGPRVMRDVDYFGRSRARHLRVRALPALCLAFCRAIAVRPIVSGIAAHAVSHRHGEGATSAVPAWGVTGFASSITEKTGGRAVAKP